ncbi:hypothetical protein EV193_103329 [Herbihabitans rhizosphaerae]|uniref:Uncharacterized protein n=1 Tax=Herbihabitans rhizosphaerae TaxID=1872711 RepID=A0A4Q7KYA1_9PSEU|nr:hypothetical protein [Herbihabitans rhizosphaerae]RZS41011.1 hypothetical protein EV193_103329 [Herbihabitans rhizosphaerae]
MSRQDRTTLLPIAVGLFSVGLVAVITVFSLFAGGRTDVPVWLSAAAMLVPVGLALAVLSVVRRPNRHGAPASGGTHRAR